MYWAEALANQTDDTALAGQFKELSEQLQQNEAKIVDELNNAQGNAQDVGGYFRPDAQKASAAMRPSATLNEAVEALNAIPA